MFTALRRGEKSLKHFCRDDKLTRLLRVALESYSIPTLVLITVHPAPHQLQAILNTFSYLNILPDTRGSGAVSGAGGEHQHRQAESEQMAPDGGPIPREEKRRKERPLSARGVKGGVVQELSAEEAVRKATNTPPSPRIGKKDFLRRGGSPARVLGPGPGAGGGQEKEAPQTKPFGAAKRETTPTRTLMRQPGVVNRRESGGPGGPGANAAGRGG